MDVNELNELRKIRDASKDFKDQKYSKKIFKKTIENYLQAPELNALDENQKERLRELFDKIEQNILKEIPNDKFKIPYQAYMEQIDTLIFKTRVFSIRWKNS